MLCAAEIRCRTNITEKRDAPTQGLEVTYPRGRYATTSLVRKRQSPHHHFSSTPPRCNACESKIDAQYNNRDSWPTTLRSRSSAAPFGLLQHATRSITSISDHRMASEALEFLMLQSRTKTISTADSTTDDVSASIGSRRFCHLKHEALHTKARPCKHPPRARPLRHQNVLAESKLWRQAQSTNGAGYDYFPV